MNFDLAFKLLIGHEGELSLDPKDRGNWTTGIIGRGELKGTKYGISAMTYPHLNIQALTLEQAKDIYRVDFWKQTDDLPDAVRFDFFDGAVNSGYVQSVKWLQCAADTAADGIIGKNTLLAVRMADPQKLAKRYNGHRLLSMTAMKGWENFNKGWAIRIALNLLDNRK